MRRQKHPHNKERGTLVEANGVLQAAPAPRFSRTAPEMPGPVAVPGDHSREILGGSGYERRRYRRAVRIRCRDLGYGLSRY